MVSFRSAAQFDKEAAIVFLSEEQVKKEEYGFEYEQLESELAFLKKAGQFEGKTGQFFPLLSAKQIVLLVGLGQEEKLDLTAVRIAVRRALQSLHLKQTKTVELIAHRECALVSTALVEGVLIGGYQWRKYLSKSKDDNTVYEKKYTIVGVVDAAVKRATTICEGVSLSRDLVNDNADVVTAEFVEKTVKALVKGRKDVSTEILGRAQMERKGLGLHLAVNQGATKEPKLIIVKYTGNAKSKAYTAIIGKGITFDTGGLNLKLSGHIENMKCDMAGSAAVVGALKNTLLLKPKKNVIFVMAMAENAIDANSYKPGDVIKGYAGKTVEIGNTDAEGRLVLADAMSYVNKNYKPKEMIDICTLTGAVIVGLGNDYTGLISNNDELAHHLLESAAKTDDRAWRLPSYPELKTSMKSDIADIKNISNTRGAGGALTAGEFLRQFVNETSWAHLDIAGTSYVNGKERLYFSHGGTGAGVRLLTDYILNYA